MQRLMQVSHEVQEEFEANSLLLGVSLCVCKLCGELLDLVHHAVRSRAIRGNRTCWQCGVIEAGLLKVGSRDFDISEMPLARL